MTCGHKRSPEAKVGSDCCSDRWVASHYVSLHDMYRLNELEEAKCLLHVEEWPHWLSKGTLSGAFNFTVPPWNQPRSGVPKQINAGAADAGAEHSNRQQTLDVAGFTQEELPAEMAAIAAAAAVDPQS